MLSTFVRFCTRWLGVSPQWPILISVLLVVLVLVGPRKYITVKKTGEGKWVIFK